MRVAPPLSGRCSPSMQVPCALHPCSLPGASCLMLARARAVGRGEARGARCMHCSAARTGPCQALPRPGKGAPAGRGHAGWRCCSHGRRCEEQGCCAAALACQHARGRTSSGAQNGDCLGRAACAAAPATGAELSAIHIRIAKVNMSMRSLAHTCGTVLTLMLRTDRCAIMMYFSVS